MWWILICAHWFSIIRHCFGLYLLKWMLSNKTVVKRLLFIYGYRAAMPGKKRNKRCGMEGFCMYKQCWKMFQWCECIQFTCDSLSWWCIVHRIVRFLDCVHCLYYKENALWESDLVPSTGEMVGRHVLSCPTGFSIIWQCICHNVSVFFVTWSQ